METAHAMGERTRDERILAARGLVKMRARKGVKASAKLQRMAQERLSFEAPTATRSQNASA